MSKPGELLSLLVYQAAIGCLFPFVCLILCLRQDTRSRFLQALGWLKPYRGQLPARNCECDWFHAVSYGEMQIALHLMESGRSSGQLPRHLLISTTIQNAAELAQSRLGQSLPDHGFTVCYLPVDFIPCLLPLFWWFKVRRFFLIETDYWPGLAYLLRWFQTKTYFLNARLSPKVIQTVLAWPGLFVPGLLQFRLVSTASELVSRRLSQTLPLKKIVNCGQIKVDLVYASHKELQVKASSDSVSVSAFGSCHLREWSDLLPMMREAATCGAVILVPRVIENANEFFKLCHDAGLNAQIYSHYPDRLESGKVAILNVMGLMHHVYHRCCLAVVGGTFCNLGGHNWMEAVVHKRPVVVGPDTRNLQDLTEMFVGDRLLHQVETGEEGRKIIQEYFRNPKELITTSIVAQERLCGLQGATKKTWQEIESAS